MESLLDSSDLVHANKLIEFLQTPKDEPEEEEGEWKNNFIKQCSMMVSTYVMCAYFYLLSRSFSLLKDLFVC